MELEVAWNVMIVGLLAGLVRSVPMDMDSIKDGIQMGAMTGIGMAMDLADKAKFQGSYDEKISLGPLKMEKNIYGNAGNNDKDFDSSEEDRKRRRRSAAEDKSPNPHRQKRSPCLGRRRAQQTTTAAPAPGGGGAANPDDLRRRKRSPDYDYDNNQNIIPIQETLAERTQAIGEKFRQIVKGMLEALAGAFENLTRSIRNGSNSSVDMQ